MNKMNSAIILLASLFPQVALAHFEVSHDPFWFLPIHWLTQHLQGFLIVGLAVIIGLMYAKERSKEK